MEYQRTVRNRQIERAKQMIKMKDPEEIKKGPNDVRRFLKRIARDKDGKEAEVSYDLDQARIDEEEKYDGYYAVATNLTDAKVKDVLNIMHKRYMIEDCFRVSVPQCTEKNQSTFPGVLHSSACLSSAELQPG